MSIHTYVYVTGPVKIIHVVKKLPTFLNFSILICNLLVLIEHNLYVLYATNVRII